MVEKMIAERQVPGADLGGGCRECAGGITTRRQPHRNNIDCRKVVKLEGNARILTRKGNKVKDQTKCEK